MGMVLMVSIFQGCGGLFGDIANPVVLQGEASLRGRKTKLQELVNQLSADATAQGIEVKYPELSGQLDSQDVVMMMRKVSDPTLFSEFSELDDSIDHRSKHYEDRNVISGVRYTYKLFIFLNGDTGSVDSPEVQAMLPGSSVLSKPLNVSCSSANGSTNIEFDDASTNETSFVVQIQRSYREDHGWSTWSPEPSQIVVSTTIPSVGQRVQKSVAYANGGGKKYRYRIQAKNDAAYSEFTAYCE